MANPLLIKPIMRWLGKLSHPRLFMLFAGLFALDTLTPDLIPFADEILLGIATLVFANWKNRKPGANEADAAGDGRTYEGSATRR